MKHLEYYLNLPYRIEIMPDTLEGGYIAQCPELPGCITYGDTQEESLHNLTDAKKVWLSAALEDDITIAEPSHTNKSYSGQFKLRLPKQLHKQLALQAEQEGVSINQYCLYLLAERHAQHTR